MLQNVRQVVVAPGRPRIGVFYKQSELMRMLPEIPKLRSFFDLFVVNGRGLEAGGEKLEAIVCMERCIRLRDVADCLRTMGLSPSDDAVRKLLEEHVSWREAMGINIAQRATFVLVLTLYCQLAELEAEKVVVDKGSFVENALRVLRSRDPQGTGMLPYSELRRMLTTMGNHRLEETEAYGVLHRAVDIDGNVHYEHLVRQLFAKDPLAEERLQQAQLFLQAVGRNAIDMDMSKRDEFIHAIRLADPMSSGYIQPERLLEVLNRNDEQFTSEELKLLTEGMEDIQCDRGINYRRFLQLIMNE
ncbi:uncharacterized protein LOC6550940 [Drosophila erecta]|uniref:EF-hand domain-containing protein n=1 Tax=Drosophila erecta TaxID=7220 RepID=B3NV56_DROER|nr:uncharacterized protein LOC6550940 [Drosophila erecta]EDV45904.1 uncharacterized protein Dere_GG18492 [Drosophila erecta]